MKQNWIIVFHIHSFSLKITSFHLSVGAETQKGRGKIVYVRQGLISKRLKNFESKTIKTICIELTKSKNKWCILFACRPTNLENKSSSEQISSSLSLIVNQYENITVTGDLNINLLNPISDTKKIFL